MNHRHPDPRVLDHPAPETAWAAAERRRAQWASLKLAASMVATVPASVWLALKVFS